jgi:hypothetical protein
MGYRRYSSDSDRRASPHLPLCRLTQTYARCVSGGAAGSHIGGRRSEMDASLELGERAEYVEHKWPCGVVVSNASVGLRNAMPFSRKPSAVSVSLVDAPNVRGE